MRYTLSVTVGSLCLSAACTQTEGQCWHDDQAAGDIGAGGTSILTGAGGFGDVAPKPQDVGDPMPPDCETVPGTACDEKCLADYTATAEKCGRIEIEAQRRVCQESAYQAYKACRSICQQQGNDCLDHCKDMCVDVWEGCDAKCKKDHVCKEKCMEALIACNKKCEEKCK
ncbi:MAG: hypothetical protein U0441_12555 [Polyangiaceae bacterium]